jgi:hypothetical protein
MPEHNRTTDTMKEGQHIRKRLPVPQKDSNGVTLYVPTWMRPNFRKVMFTAIPKAERVSRFAATWIDVQPLIGGGLLVWVYDNDTVQTLIID